MLDKEHIIRTYSKLDYFELYKEYKQLKIEIQEAKEGKGVLTAEVLEVYHSVVEMILLRRSLKIAEKPDTYQKYLRINSEAVC